MQNYLNSGMLFIRHHFETNSFLFTASQILTIPLEPSMFALHFFWLWTNSRVEIMSQKSPQPSSIPQLEILWILPASVQVQAFTARHGELLQWEDPRLWLQWQASQPALHSLSHTWTTWVICLWKPSQLLALSTFKLFMLLLFKVNL